MALVALCALGCGTLQAYPGPRRAPVEVALLKPAASNSAHVVLDAVNGHELGLLQDRVEVLPGVAHVRATVILEHGPRKITRSHEFSFEAKPGGEYTLSADWFLYGPRIRVADAQGIYVAEAVTRPDQLPHVSGRSSEVISGEDP